ncbi:MAG: IS200/IS605 family transposase [Candidatus Sumerlaeia bacterium]
MPQSLSLTILHIIFSTKNRERFLGDAIRQGAHGYLAATIRNMGCECFRVGGVEDHVHLAVRLSRTLTIADLVEQIKTSSSKWAKTQNNSLSAFAWQKGYACFSISPKDLNSLIQYIDEQGQRHKKQSFQEEFKMFLDHYGIDYNESYVWD